MRQEDKILSKDAKEKIKISLNLYGCSNLVMHIEFQLRNANCQTN